MDMSSSSSRMQPNLTAQRKRSRRAPLACDHCRTRKLKCEYGDGTRCARCIKSNIACSGKFKQAKSEDSRRIEALEQKLCQMESVLSRMSSTPVPVQENATGSKARLCSDITSGKSKGHQVNTDLNEKTQQLSLGLLGIPDGFPPGQSSEISFLDEVLDVRGLNSRHSGNNAHVPAVTAHFRRLPLQTRGSEIRPGQYSFPEPDLLRDLIDLYFDRCNVYFWLLHRPSFEANLAKGLHLEDRCFAEVVLLVAATGARQSGDPRVLADNSGGNWLSSGWKWFSQVSLFPKTLFGTLTLYELQKFCLAGDYLFAIRPHDAWSLAGIGLRLAQGIGIHQKKRGQQWTIESELWKRAFWALLCIDRFSCAVFGRPCFTHEEQFEIELPVLADEEYWDNADPSQAFKQPHGKPSKQASFTYMIQLSEILAFSLRTIYAVGKFKAFLYKSTPRWTEEIVQRIDTALDRWHDTIPSYLRWPVSSTESVFYDQSAALYLTYYSIRIQAHRSFIPSLIGRSPVSLSNLTICANAARSSCGIFEVMSRNSPPVLQSIYAPIALMAAVFLFVFIWEGKKSGLTVDCTQELRNIRHCLDYLRLLETRYVKAGECSDIIEHLLLQEDLSSPDSSYHLGQSTSQPMSFSGPVQSDDAKHDSPASPDSTSASSLNLQSATHNRLRLSGDLTDLFRAFISDGTLMNDGDGGWGVQVGTQDDFFGHIFASFDPAQPSGDSAGLEQCN